MIQYIVRGNSSNIIKETAIEALQNSCRWIRLDLRQLSSANLPQLIKSLQDECRKHEAILSIENDVNVVKEFGLDGVHLTCDNKIDSIEARKILGEEHIMGITISEPSQVPFLPRTAIDYVEVNADSSIVQNSAIVVQQMKDIGSDEPVIARIKNMSMLVEVMSAGVGGVSCDNYDVPPSALHEMNDKLNTIVNERLEKI